MNDQISLLSFFFLQLLSKKQSKKFMKFFKKKHKWIWKKTM